jgi:hypothetical protein
MLVSADRIRKIIGDISKITNDIISISPSRIEEAVDMNGMIKKSIDIKR